MIKSNITGKTYLSPVEAFNDYCDGRQCKSCPFHKVVASPLSCLSYVHENPDEATAFMNCEKASPYFINLKTGRIYFSLLDVFDDYCDQHLDCEGCCLHSIEDKQMEEDYGCYNYFSNHVDDYLSLFGYARAPLNGQNTEIDDQDTAIPALCELFHVLPNEDFYIQDTDGSLFLDASDNDPYATPMICRIDKQGLPTQTVRYGSEGEPNEEEMDGWTIARVINGDLHIIRKSRVWTDQDVADARAVRRIFPSAWYVERLPHSLNLTVGTLTSSPFEEPPLLKPLVIPINPKYFPSVREGETAYITIIKGDDNNAGS